MLLVLLLARLLPIKAASQTHPVFQHLLILRLHFLDDRLDLTHVVLVASHELRVAFVENREIGLAGE